MSWGISIKDLQSNPDISYRIDEPQQPKRKAMTKEDENKASFLQLWKYLGGPPLEQEYRFHGRRKWRFDFAHPQSMTAIELEGGVWSNGRHVRGQGYINDCIKYNAAQNAHWNVQRLATGMVTEEHVKPIIDYIFRERNDA